MSNKRKLWRVPAEAIEEIREKADREAAASDADFVTSPHPIDGTHIRQIDRGPWCPVSFLVGRIGPVMAISVVWDTEEQMVAHPGSIVVPDYAADLFIAVAGMTDDETSGAILGSTDNARSFPLVITGTARGYRVPFTALKDTETLKGELYN